MYRDVMEIKKILWGNPSQSIFSKSIQQAYMHKMQ